YAAAGQHAQSEAVLRRMVERDPSNLEAFAALGRLYVDTGRLEEARAQFEQLEAKDNTGAAATMVGMIFEAQQRTGDAARAYEKALATNPRAGAAANNLAWIFQEQGRFDEALKWALVATEQLHNLPAAQDTLAWIRVRRGEYREALPLLAEN